MTSTIPASVTRLLHALSEGEHGAIGHLFELVYDELRAQAHRQRQAWHGNNTMSTTAMVHEAYLKLVDQREIRWNSRAHFLGVAARAMRHILIDYARKQERLKRGGGLPDVPFDEVEHQEGQPPSIAMTDDQAEGLVAMGEALERLRVLNERQSRVIECRFFGGMTIEDTAIALEVSPSTVKRDWGLAQAWLYREVKAATSSG